MLDLAIGAEDHRKAFDLSLAGRLRDEFGHAALVAVGFRLHGGRLLHRLAWCLPRQHEAMMLGDKAALAVEQAEPCAAPQASHHRAGRMRHIGVERRAEEGEPARHGRLHVRAQAERSPRHLGYAGKTAIELDGVEFFAVTACEIHHRLEHGILRMALVKLVAQEVVARFLGGSAAKRIDQTVFGDPGRTRLRETRQKQRRTHVDGGIGDHEFRIGPRDQTIVG